MEKEKYITQVIRINDIDLPCPNLKNTVKTDTIAEWMIEWIETGLKSKKLQHNALIPTKSDLAYMLGVSKGTIQNAIRNVEDRGYLVSKQKIGTLINAGSKSGSIMKLTSKRDRAAEAIKKFFKDNNFVEGDIIPSTRKLAELTKIPLNTLRSAMSSLISDNIIQHSGKQEFKLINSNYTVSEASCETLVHKIKKEIENYITNNCKVSDKLPPNTDFAKMFNVGNKTIHDAVRLLVKEGILVTLRGKYGTIVSSIPYGKNKFEPKREISIFAPAAETAYYYYEKTKQRLKRMIAEEYYAGSKLPSIVELAGKFDLSPNTIRRAIKELTKEGYLSSAPGRWGGTFVISCPSPLEASFQWLALSSDYIKDITKNI